MLLTEYIEKRKRTEDMTFSGFQKLEYLSYGLYGESGELVDLTKKVVYHQHPLEQELDNYKFEIGDDLWYVFGLISELEIDLKEIFMRMGYTESNTGNELTVESVFNFVTRKAHRNTAFLLSTTHSLMKTAYLINDKIYTEAIVKQQPIMNTNAITKHFANHLINLFRLIAYVGTDLETVLRMNIEKIERRYPEGFEAERSLVRM